MWLRWWRPCTGLHARFGPETAPIGAKIVFLQATYAQNLWCRVAIQHTGNISRYETHSACKLLIYIVI